MIGCRLSSLCGVVWRVPWPHEWLLSAIAVATTHKWLIRRGGILLTLIVKRTTSLNLTRRIGRRCASQHGPALKFLAEPGQDRCQQKLAAVVLVTTMPAQRLHGAQRPIALSLLP